MKQPFLILDTCINPNYLLLCNEQEILDTVLLPSGIQLSETFFSILQNLLQKHTIEPKQLSWIFCGLGPGSFTGSRVGISFAQTMQFSLKIPVLGYPSLCAFTPPENTPFISLSDAKSQGFYALEGTKSGDTITFSSHPKRIRENNFKLPVVHAISAFQNKSLEAPKIYPVDPNFTFLHRLALEKFKKNLSLAQDFLAPYYLPIANNEKSVLV